jgi:hypothetical protein
MYMSLAASGIIFQYHGRDLVIVFYGKNRSFRASEEGDWEDF